MNPVISREYVEKNYIPKDELRKFIKSEFKMIDKNMRTWETLEGQCQLKGMKAAYTAINNIFLEEIDEDSKDNNKR